MEDSDNVSTEPKETQTMDKVEVYSIVEQNDVSCDEIDRVLTSPVVEQNVATNEKSDKMELSENPDQSYIPNKMFDKMESPANVDQNIASNENVDTVETSSNVDQNVATNEKVDTVETSSNVDRNVTTNENVDTVETSSNVDQNVVSKAKIIFKCECPDVEFSHGPGIVAHFRNVHGFERQSYVCLSCDKGLMNIAMMSKHIQKINKEVKCRGLPSPKCDSCPVEGYLIPELKEHAFKFHVKPSEFHCRSPCNLVFESMSKLITHWTVEHGLLGILRCGLCKYGTNHITKLQLHLVNHPTTKLNKHAESIYACGRCDEKFSTPVQIEDHVKDFHGYQEPTIKKPESQSASKLEAVNLHSAYPYYGCGLCAKKFFKRKLFYQHWTVEHESSHKETALVFCNDCCIYFPSFTSLEEHLALCMAKVDPSQMSTEMILSAERPGSNKKKGPGGKYDCIECRKFKAEEDGLVGLVNHWTKMHSGGGFVSCGYCSKKFNWLPAFENHLEFHKMNTSAKKYHEKPAYICARCNFGFRYRSDLVNHLQKTHQETLPQVNCKLCSTYRTIDKDLMKEHSNFFHLNLDVSKNIFECTDCGEQFVQPNNIRLHKCPIVRLSKKQKKSTFQCGICQAYFGRMELLVAHFKSQHGMSNSFALFRCVQCKVTFLSESELTNHENTKHINTTVSDVFHLCQKCGLKVLEKECSIEATSNCQLCNSPVAAANAETVKGAHQTIHEKIELFVCNICPKNCQSRDELNTHFKSEHIKRKKDLDFVVIFGDEEKSGSSSEDEASVPAKPQLKCPECNVKAAEKSHLDKHMELFHVNQDDSAFPFQCGLCSVPPFKQIIMLEKHLRMEKHSDVPDRTNVYVCGLCSASMGDSRDSLLNHFKSSHLNTKTAKDGQTLTAEEIKRCETSASTPDTKSVAGPTTPEDLPVSSETRMDSNDICLTSSSDHPNLESTTAATLDGSSAVIITPVAVAATATLVSSQLATVSVLPSSVSTACVHPASSSSPIIAGPSTATPVGISQAMSEATTSKVSSLTEPPKASSETSGLEQLFQKILVQCSEGQIGLKTAFEIDNTADWYLAQKLQISLNSAISRFGVNLFKQNKPSVVGKSPQVDKPVDQHRSSNNLATRSMHRTTQESTSSSVLKAPRPPKIFTGHSSSRSMTSKETYVRPMHEGRHSYGYGRRKPEEKQEHHRSQSRPVSLPDMNRPPPLPNPTCSSWRSKPQVHHTPDKDYDEPPYKQQKLDRQKHF